MKSTIVRLTIAAITLIGTVSQADARPHHSTRIYISGYTRCGEPIYTERYFVGYDRCGNPVWGYRTVRQEYRPRYVAPCPPPVYHYSNGRCEDRGSRTRVTIEGFFRL